MISIAKLVLAIILTLAIPTVAHSTGHIIPNPPRTVVFVPPCRDVKLIDLGEYVITAYCPCEMCCGEWAKNRPNGKVIVNGIELRWGSCASPLPQGTVVFVEGVGQFTVHDSTADWIVDKYDGKIIDIYFETHEEAVRFGKKARNVYLVEVSE